MKNETVKKFAVQCLQLVGYTAEVVYNQDGSISVNRSGAEAFRVVRPPLHEYVVCAVNPPLRDGLKPSLEKIGDAKTPVDAMRLITFAVLGQATADIEVKLLEEENIEAPPEHNVFCLQCNNLVAKSNMASETTCKVCAGQTA